VKNQGRHGNFEQVMLPLLDAAYNLARWWFAIRRLPRTCRTPMNARASTSHRFRGESAGAWLLQILRNAAYSKLKAERSGIEVFAQQRSACGR